MRKLITGGNNYTVQHMGLNQSFMVAMEKHDNQPIDISGSITEWVTKTDFDKLKESVKLLFNARNQNDLSVCIAKIQTVLKDLEVDE